VVPLWLSITALSACLFFSSLLCHKFGRLRRLARRCCLSPHGLGYAVSKFGREFFDVLRHTARCTFGGEKNILFQLSWFRWSAIRPGPLLGLSLFPLGFIPLDGRYITHTHGTISDKRRWIEWFYLYRRLFSLFPASSSFALLTCVLPLMIGE
jgi:hypothetical protein